MEDNGRNIIPVIFRTNPDIFRTNPVKSRIKSVIFGTNPVMRRTNPVIFWTNSAMIMPSGVIFRATKVIKPIIIRESPDIFTGDPVIFREGKIQPYLGQIPSY